jgi:hypothetical protein
MIAPEKNSNRPLKQKIVKSSVNRFKSLSLRVIYGIVFIVMLNGVFITFSSGVIKNTAILLILPLMIIAGIALIILPLLTTFVMIGSALSKNIAKASQQDLRYIGFTNPEDDYVAYKSFREQTSEATEERTRAFYHLTGIGWVRDLDDRIEAGAKASKRLDAFFSYGFMSLFVKLGKHTVIHNRDGRMAPDDSGRFIESELIPTLMFKTIWATQKIIRQKKLNGTSNPIPYAAYLFRMASLHNNPENKDVQERALLLWKDERSLTLAFQLRDWELSLLESFTGVPDEWINEFNETRQKEVKYGR